MIWLISDTHFNHRNLVNLAHRPEDFTEQIIANWKARVADTDVVLHLGDLIVGQNSTLAGILESLPGRKILLRGNHDQERPSWYERRGIDLVCDKIQRGDILFSHAPEIPLPVGIRYNVHGHLHSDDHRRESEPYLSSAYYRDHLKQYLLCEIESTLAPIRLEYFMIQACSGKS